MKQHSKGHLARLRAPIAGLILALVFLVHGPTLHQALAAPQAPQLVHVDVQAAVQPGTVCGVATASVAAVAQQQDLPPLPDNVEQLVAAFLTIAAGIATVIGLTGLGKWLAKVAGHEIGGNQVRALLGGAAVLTSVIYASFCNCAGVVAFPVSGSQADQLRWLWMSSGTLILLAMAVWKKFVRPEPELIVGESLSTAAR